MCAHVAAVDLVNTVRFPSDKSLELALNKQLLVKLQLRKKLAVPGVFEGISDGHGISLT